MTVAVLFGSFALLLLLSVPIGIALGISTLVTIVYSESVPVLFLMKELITSLDSFPIMAVPFFILAGEIMGKGGISERLFNFANSLVGSKTGGFAIATIVTCMFFAAISGSGPATVAAVGSIMIPAMVRKGYDKPFATATVAAAGSIGVIIPPSIPMVIYGVTGGASVGDMFIAGILPGILVGVALMAWAYIYSKKKGYKGTLEKITLGHIGRTFWEAKWAMVIPIIILGGIYGGIFTPTEAAVVAVVYGLLVGLFLHRELKVKQLPKIIADSSLTTATVLIIVGTANAFGKLLTVEQIPNQIAEWMLSLTESKIILILLITALLLLVGCFMDTIAAIIILTPILLPIALNIGYDPIHFGIIMVVSLAIGFITPPLGVNLFVSSGISGLSIERISKAVIPFFLAMVFSVLMIVFIPEISMWLVSLGD
ncbi:TRAP transporter large permease [Piscibacillus halophilus]|uniref:C4-dicarboxylate transporter, DctM subunit n=1 Tax=Piscibacillus halophilus TaxID=571933 RepID=A0A1H9LTI9_9BACI|nr:TRAP transporter large permease [Piscibacillus halophilus]SER14710.1 C4-dicarboxylate transporter, DctM subunit [Piscibacillus halophilus]